MNFETLHEQTTPLLICNVWDVPSAKAAARLNYPAIGTSSGAIATMLGYKDGEQISFEELYYMVERITTSVDLPLTVDLEAGYSRDVDVIVNHIQRLAALGVVGINLEDSLVGQERVLLPYPAFAKSLKAICTALREQEIAIFVNVRTDTFLLGVDQPVSATIDRAKAYQAAGAHGLFVPCVEKEKDMEALVRELQLPLNVMCMPDLPDFDTLQKLGVKRISMGNFVYAKLNQQLEQSLSAVLDDNSFKNLFS
ncbi:MAG: isocitrate lyase/phosphoenolpyruvate mutase family protein [Bacteroidota bacterium]